MTIKRHKSAAALTIIEVMVAVIIFAIVAIGSFLLFAAGRSRINLQEHYRVATHLAAQKLEELKAGNYYDILVGTTEENLSLEDLSYSRSVETEDVGLYKKVRVTINWGPIDKECNVSLVTFIAPK
ncbi:MAG: hypothetical protein AMJ43_00615 [Coxiella sp. DG_40]|nr:MAG: hypothetical protein AMJ43_00615 [Coxiella sp. DG_40]